MDLASLFRSYMGSGNVPQPKPMQPTMGTAIRGMFGGGTRPSALPGDGANMGQGIGQAVRALAQAPDRTGGLGQQVRAITPSMPVLKPTASPAAVPFTGRMANNRRRGGPV